MDDWKREVDGTPQLPAEYRRYLLEVPLAAEIIAVGETQFDPRPNGLNVRTTSVTLNVGRTNGVLPELEFQTQIAPPFLKATVTRVLDSTCEAEVEQLEERNPLPAVGVKLTTGRQEFSR